MSPELTTVTAKSGCSQADPPALSSRTLKVRPAVREMPQCACPASALIGQLRRMGVEAERMIGSHHICVADPAKREQKMGAHNGRKMRSRSPCCPVHI